MIIYFALIIFWFVSHLLVQKLSDQKKRNILTFIIGVSMFLVMGLRHYTVGSDIEHYLDVYNNDNLWTASFINQFEFGYYGFLRVLKFIGIGNQGYIIIVSFIFSYSFSVFFKRYSSNILMSFYLYLTIGLFTVSMSAIRQSFAISIILFAVSLLLERKVVFYLIVVLIASTFHRSAIIMLPLVFLSNVKLINLKKGLVLYFIILSVLLIKNYIFQFAIPFIPEKYMELYIIADNENQINVLLVVISLLIPLFMLFFWKLPIEKKENENKENALFFIMTLMGSLFTILGLINPMVTRLTYYFIPGYIILIPNIINSLKIRKNRFILYLIISILSLVYFIISTIDGTLKIDNYKFFWI